MITNGTPDFAFIEEYTGIEPIDHAELTKDWMIIPAAGAIVCGRH